MASIKERLAVVEEQAKALPRIEAKVDALQKTIDELVGAKKFLFGITGLVATVIAIVTGWINLHRGN